MLFEIQDQSPAFVPQVATLWQHGWADGHAKVVPQKLVALRTSESFAIRSETLSDVTRIAVAGDQVLGFTMLKSDELYQMYVASTARGLGVAQALIQDAEDRLFNMGYATIWLACAVGNDRAARFYEKTGWVKKGIETVELETLATPFPLPIWRFEKDRSVTGQAVKSPSF